MDDNTPHDKDQDFIDESGHNTLGGNREDAFAASEEAQGSKAKSIGKEISASGPDRTGWTYSDADRKAYAEAQGGKTENHTLTANPPTDSEHMRQNGTELQARSIDAVGLRGTFESLEFPVSCEEAIQKVPADKEIEVPGGHRINLRQLLHDCGDHRFNTMAELLEAIENTIRREVFS